MVMELAQGGELFDRIIARGSFSERDAVKVLNMILEAVRYLHALGITHRDLKPENLLYYHPGNDSKLLLTDFGLASTRRSGDDVTMTTTCGTPEYIAPEVRHQVFNRWVFFNISYNRSFLWSRFMYKERLTPRS